MGVLAVLEGHATALAAPHLGSDALARLRALNDTMASCLHDADVIGFSQANRQIHHALTARCPNTYVVESLRATWERLDTHRATVFFYIPQRAWHSLEEHARLVALIEAGADAWAIERAAREHKLQTVAPIRRYSSLISARILQTSRIVTHAA